MQKYLEVNQELRLYPASVDFAKPLFQLIAAQRDYLRRHLPWADEVTSEQDMRRILRQDIQFNRGGQKLTTYIRYRAEAAGAVSLVRIDKIHKKAEIGYWLREDLQGQGIMTQCVERLIFYVFKTTDIQRLYMQISSENKASLALARRIGFKHEGTLRRDALINGAFCDMEVFGLLRGEFEERGERREGRGRS